MLPSCPDARVPLLPATPSMQPREVAALPRGEDWVYELMWGGERVRAIKRNGGAKIVARDGRNLTNRFPRIAASVVKLRTGAVVIDGEILYLETYSRDALSLLAQTADDLSGAGIVLLACDLLADDGRDVRHLSLLCRRLLLASVVQGAPIVLCPLVPATADAMVAMAVRLGLRGVLAKRSGSAYRPNALNPDWVKVTLCRGPGAGSSPHRALPQSVRHGCARGSVFLPDMSGVKPDPGVCPIPADSRRPLHVQTLWQPT